MINTLQLISAAAAAIQQAPRALATLQPILAATTAPTAAVTLPPSAGLATAPAVTAPAPALVAPTPTPAASPATPSATPGFELPSLLLSTVVWATTLAAVIIVLLPERTPEQRSRVRSVALGAAALALVLVLVTMGSAISLGVGATPDQLHEETGTWIAGFAFSIHYHLSADGVTLSLLILSTVLFLSVFLAAWKRQERVRLYCVLLLLLETAVNGALCAADVTLFLLFFAMQAVPLWLLLRCFGGAGRERVSIRAPLAVLVAVALLTVSFMLAVVHSGVHSSDLNDLLTTVTPLPDAAATAGFWLAFAAFALSFAVVPLHGWLIDATDTASSGVAAIIAGVLVRLSGYGMVRFAVGLFPAQANRFGTAVMVLAVISAFWGASLAVSQPTLRRMVAALTIVQMALVLLAVSAPNMISLTGAVLQLVAGGLSGGLLLLLCGALEGRARTGALDRLGGLANQAPRLAGFWIFGCLAAIGAPLLAGFSAEVMLFVGVFPVHPFATVAVVLATLVSTAALAWSVQRAFLGPAREEFARVRDTTALELGYLWPLVVFLVAFGTLAGRVVPAISTGLAKIASSLAGFP